MRGQERVSRSTSKARSDTTHHPPEALNLLDDQLPHAFGAVLPLKVKVELVLAFWFVGRLVPHGEVRMLERLVAGDALRRVECEKLGEEIEGKRIGLREELLEGDASLVRKRADVVLGLFGEEDDQQGCLGWLGFSCRSREDCRLGAGFDPRECRGSAGRC